MPKYSFLGADADSINHNRLVQIVPDLRQQTMHVQLATICNEPIEMSNIIPKLKPQHLTAIVGYEKEAKCLLTEQFAPSQFESVKKNFLMSEAQNADYFIVGSKALISVANPDDLADLSYLFTNLTHKTQFNITHTSVVLVYGFNRVYPDYFGEKRVGLVHVSGETATIIVIDRGKLLWHGRKRPVNLIDTTELRIAIDGIEKEVQSKEDNFAFDILLLSGEISTNNIDLISNFKKGYNLENWDLRRIGLFDFGDCGITTTHEWVIALCGALMAIENLGIDLSLTNQTLIHELKQNVHFHLHESIQEKLVEKGLIIGRAIWPAIVAQSRVVAACLLIGLSMFGYRYWAMIKEENNLQQQMANETHRSSALVNVKQEYADYKIQVATINTRLNQIYSIRESQMAVATTLKELLDSTPNLVNYGHIEINQTNIKAEGESFDKTTVVNFISKMGLSGKFQDVNPIYDSQTDNSKCAFKFTTNYTGIVRSLNPRTPVQQQQIAKIN